MKILLDAHISGRTVGKALTERGHDVRAIDTELELEGLTLVQNAARKCSCLHAESRASL